MLRTQVWMQLILEPTKSMQQYPLDVKQETWQQAPESPTIILPDQKEIQGEKDTESFTSSK